MGLDVINSVEIFSNKSSLEIYIIWSGHLKNNSSWYLKNISFIDESVKSKYSPDFDEDFIVINGKIIAYGELRILNVLHGMHRAPNPEEYCEGCKQFNC
jgi:hypothetical protein